ncbi:hypothetical protein HK102_003217, partial [Quaeritorhiza haematococci]
MKEGGIGDATGVTAAGAAAAAAAAAADIQSGVASNGPHRLWGIPEVIRIIAAYCDPRVFVLVCKDWYRIARPLLWRRVRLGDSTDVAKCMDHLHWIVTVESPFEMWLVLLLPLLPNLRELVLHNVEILDATLAVLFDLNIRVLKLDRSDDVDCWDFYWIPPIDRDRVRARSFLHRLVSIDFGNGLFDGGELTIIKDAMHEGLRKINFGVSFDLPIDLLSAPHHLTVLCAAYPRNPESFFRIIADHCPHLRALSCPDLVMDDDPDWAAELVENFRYFMKRRGAQLVALQFSMEQGDIEELFEATMQECRSLEWFGIEDTRYRFDPDLFTSFLERCGRRLKYLTMDVGGSVEGGAEKWVKDFFGTQLPILCPNMRRGCFRVGISSDDGKWDGHVLYKGEGKWEEKVEKIMTHGYFDHT